MVFEKKSNFGKVLLKSFPINSSKYFQKCKNFEKFNVFPKVKIQLFSESKNSIFE